MQPSLPADCQASLASSCTAHPEQLDRQQEALQVPAQWMMPFRDKELRAKVYSKKAIITCLEVCCAGFSLAGRMVCESTWPPSKGSAAQLALLLSLQVHSLHFSIGVWRQRLLSSTSTERLGGSIFVRRILCKTLTP